MTWQAAETEARRKAARRQAEAARSQAEDAARREREAQEKLEAMDEHQLRDQPDHALSTLEGSNFHREFVRLSPDRWATPIFSAQLPLTLPPRPRTRARSCRLGRNSITVTAMRLSPPPFLPYNPPPQHAIIRSGNESIRVKEGERHRIMMVVYRMVQGYAREHSVDEGECQRFLDSLMEDWEATDNVSVAAQRVWTSAKRLQVAGTRGIEFCSIYNHIVRADRNSLSRFAAIYAQGLQTVLSAPEAPWPQVNSLSIPPPLSRQPACSWPC